MKPYIFIIASILIVIIVVLAYQSTDDDMYPLNPAKTTYSIHNKSMIQETKPVRTNRCVPSEMLYDNGYVKNKGFVNETMYKPEVDTTQLVFETKLIENHIPINDDRCMLSSDLPLGNIHTTYLINKNSSKLSL